MFIGQPFRTHIKRRNTDDAHSYIYWFHRGLLSCLSLGEEIYQGLLLSSYILLLHHLFSVMINEYEFSQVHYGLSRQRLKNGDSDTATNSNTHQLRKE